MAILAEDTLVHHATTIKHSRSSKFVSKKYVLATATSFLVGLACAGQLLSCAEKLPSIVHTNYKAQSCDRLLDELDQTFDQRRQVRQDSMTSQKSSREQKKFDLFEPEAVCFSEERFGNERRYGAFGDGPKFVCGVDFLAAKSANSSAGCLVYSVGSNNKIDFEKGVNRFLGCETHTFDPTLTSPFVGDKYAVFHPWGIGEDGKNGTVLFRRKESSSQDSMSFTSKSLETITQELGHGNRTIDILKIDCEGCEWDALPPFFDLIASGKLRVDQVQVELHASVPQERVFEFFDSVDRAKLRIFHKERNGWGCYGYRCVEYSFASEHFLREANRAVMCPVPTL